MKKVLLLCASHNDLGLIRALRKLGFYIIATGNKENLPGEPFVDKYICADYSDKELILNIAKEENIDAICQCCNDFGVYTAAYVAEEMNLPGYDSYETTLLLHNKDKFKRLAIKKGIITPQTLMCTSMDEARDAVSRMSYPIIVKPTDASAGNGISKVIRQSRFDEAVRNAFENSRQKKVVIEPFIEGSQHGFCSFLVNRRVVAYCTNNEYSIVNPYRVEIDTFPADGWESVCHILIEEIESLASVLNLKDGIFHLQYILKDGKPYIIEVMRRILGNMYSVPANMLTGIDWDYWEARAKTGMDCSMFPKHVYQEGYFAYKAIMSKEDGRIASISIPDNYKKYIFDRFMLMKKGDIIHNHMKEPVGFLFMMFSNDKEMKNVLIDNYNNDIVKVSERG